MKKLLLLFFVLLTSVSGVWAQSYQVTETGTNTLNAATIKSKADAGTLFVSIQNHTTSANYYINKEGKAANAFDGENGTTTWQVVSYNSGYALKNCDGNYIKDAARPVTFTNDISQALLFMPTDCEANVGDIGSGYNSSQAVRWIVKKNTTYTMNTNGMNASITVQFNGGRGNWTCLFTYEVSPAYEITFSCKVGETLIYTEVGRYKDGSSVNVPDLPGYTASPASVTVSGADASHDVAYTVSSYPVNFPRSQTEVGTPNRYINSVTFATDINSPVIDGLYQNSSTPRYQDLTASKTVILVPNTTVTPSFNISGVWMHGFVYIDLNDDGDFTDDGELVSYNNVENPNLATGMPAFTSPEDEGTYRMRIKLDWGSTDPAGNTGVDPHTLTSDQHIIKVGGMIVDLELIVSEDQSTFVTSNIQPFIDNSGTGYFQINSTVAGNLSSMIERAGEDGIISAEEYTSLFNYLDNNIRRPVTGYYLLKSYYNNYMFNATGVVTTKDKTAADVTTIVRLERDGATKNYKIAIQGSYLKTPTKSADVTYDGTGTTFTAVTTATTIGKVAFDAGGSDYGVLHAASGQEYKVVGWEKNSDASQWTVEDISSVSISLTAANDNTSAAHTYATLCVPFAISGLTGVDSKDVKAYAPTKSGDYIVPGSGATTVTEGTPVILIGAEGATSVTATIGSNYATTPATTNVLTGTFTGTSFDCTAGTNNYVLGFDSTNGNRIGFYHVSGGSSFALNANRAYLNTSGGGSVKGFAISFDELVDGIKAMDKGQLTMDNAEIYNLAGQRVSKLQRGVNIVNGKKVIVK